MKRFFLLIWAVVVVATSIQAQSIARETFEKDLRISANNYQAYPDKNLPTLTPAPKGYTPFFINHYGRHGSRWLIDPKDYSIPVEQLSKGEINGKLTQRGKEVLAACRNMLEASRQRLGELSDIGAEQHQGIARRMVENFPEVWQGDAHVDARSTVVIRCILSMLNATSTLKSLNPQLSITTDASEHDMYYMNYRDTAAIAAQRAAKPAVEAMKAKLFTPKRLETITSRLFNDKKFVRDSIADTFTLVMRLFDVVSNMQSHHDFENIDLYTGVFTADDATLIWTYNNARWYLYSGDTPLTHHTGALAHRHLLLNFIEAADRAIASGRNSATLRFGHESVVLPTVCLMGLNGMDYSTSDLATLAEHWRSYEVFPMAANIQIIYYRKAGSDDILVKILLNEHEASLPIATDCAPYYHWRDVRAHFMSRIGSSLN
ncbi:MAG: histidine-type phosphatase [Muribaculaceae bacterium]|nr:histidine-type phosphatase [Muribaculaceae bacterium]